MIIFPPGLDVTQRDSAECAYNRLMLQLDLMEDDNDHTLEMEQMLAEHRQQLELWICMFMEKIALGLHSSPVWQEAAVLNMQQIQSILDIMVVLVGSLDPKEKMEGEFPERRARSLALAQAFEKQRRYKNYFVSTVESFFCSLFLAVYRYNWPYVGKLSPEDVRLEHLLEEGKRYVRALEINQSQMNNARV
ncbi:hypothetical protein Voja6_00020 [Pseudomonas phage vB_PpuM-Voja-6]